MGGLSERTRFASSSAAPAVGDVPRPGWQARLTLGFERRGERTLLADCAHLGPLRVQKALYPEGLAVCQAIVLHPPGGIAGGDSLEIFVTAAAAAHAQLTTPGAGKWYRSGGRRALQSLRVRVDGQAIVEWLPQETIVFDGAEAQMLTRVDLAAGAVYCGWEILCLGRTAAGERFSQGRLELSTRIEQAGRPLWIERGCLRGGSPWLAAAAGLGGLPVSGTLLLAGRPVEAEWLAACRAVPPAVGLRVGVTALPGVLVARCLGPASEPAKAWLTEVWRRLRPLALAREAVPPRIWST